MSFEKPKFETKEVEPKKFYLQETLVETKNRLSKYFPNIYREIPTQLDYKDKAKELRVDYGFDGENLNINIETPEDLSDKNSDSLKSSETEFLVFKDEAGGETISKKAQDSFLLSHEYTHGINRKLIEEYRPDMVSITEAKRKEFREASEDRKREMQREERNSIFPVLGESLPISLERAMVEKILQDHTLGEKEKNDAKLFWDKHEDSLSKKKLESDPKSKYTEIDEAMIYYKIFQKFGEDGIIDFIKNFDFEKLSKIRKYDDSEERILSENYKEFLEADTEELMEKFLKE